jgi:hypothetical protein
MSADLGASSMTPIAADWHDGQINLTVMAGHSRLKDGVASGPEIPSITYVLC